MSKNSYKMWLICLNKCPEYKHQHIVPVMPDNSLCNDQNANLTDKNNFIYKNKNHVNIQEQKGISHNILLTGLINVGK